MKIHVRIFFLPCYTLVAHTVGGVGLLGLDSERFWSFYFINVKSVQILLSKGGVAEQRAPYV